MLQFQYHKSSFGELIIGAFEDDIVLCDWRYRKMRQVIDRRIKAATADEWVEESHPLIDELINQLHAYSAGDLRTFDLPVRCVGTQFQQRVWQALLKIPYGVKRSYGDLARALGDPKAVRAVASANGANALALVVPCHRIIGDDGSLTGYAGGLQVKKRLLNHEARCVGVGVQQDLDFGIGMIQ